MFMVMGSSDLMEGQFGGTTVEGNRLRQARTMWQALACATCPQGPPWLP